MREFLSKLLNFGADYWVEVSTQEPRCTYYFGPFEQKAEAEASVEGYLDDLRGEGAQGIDVVVKRCKPTMLTIFDETEGVAADRLPFPALSGQV